MRRLLCLVLFASVVLATGCRNCNQVESALRARENDLRETREELGRTTAYAHALESELRCIKGENGPPAPGEPPPLLTAPVRSLALARQTGGHDCGSGLGDDGIQVVLQPLDCDNQPVKVPAAALIQVQEITPEGLKAPLSTWQIPPEQLRQSWRTGLLTNGFVVILPWKIWPSTEKVRVVAQLRLSDGRVFEADKDVTLRLPPVARRRSMPRADVTIEPPVPKPGPDGAQPPPPVSVPAKPAPEQPEPKPKEELPAPRPADPPADGPQLPPPLIETRGQPFGPEVRPAATLERPQPRQ
jgi:hypothetical protein